MRGLLLSVLFIFSTSAMADETRFDFTEEAQATTKDFANGKANQNEFDFSEEARATNKELFTKFDDLYSAGKVDEREYRILVNNAITLHIMRTGQRESVAKVYESTESKLRRWEDLLNEGKITEQEYDMLVKSQEALDRMKSRL